MLHSQCLASTQADAARAETLRSADLSRARAPADARVVAWQDRLTPLWKRFTGGCHLNRKMDDLIAPSGFRITELRTCYLPGPRLITFTYQGFAQPE
jgi:hypothetical protein